MSVRQVSLIFEDNDIKCFGRLFRVRKLKAFLEEYNEMFNGINDKVLNNEVLRHKFYTKHLKLNAIYTSLLYGNGENARKEFKRMFNVEYTDTAQLNLVVNEANKLLTKIRILTPEKSESKKDGVSFNKLIALVESSKGATIDRSIKLFEFKEQYDIELKKWQAI